MDMLTLTNTRQDVDTSITYNLSQTNTLWCVYEHHVQYIEGVKLMYVGSCLLRDIFDTNAPRRNKAWREHVLGADRITLKIVATFETPLEAHRTAAQIIREQQPFCNKHGEHDNEHGSVICITDGKVFKNASQAAKYYGIATGSMSNHLNGRVGYKTLHGMTFTRE